MISFLYIALGGALGAVSRVALAGWLDKKLGDALPWGILSVNILGSLMIGLLFYATLPHGKFTMDTNIKMFLIGGFCGGFTTFSTFSLQSLELLRSGDYLKFMLYTSLSVVLCIGATALGFAIAQSVSKLNG